MRILHTSCVRLRWLVLVGVRQLENNWSSSNGEKKESLEGFKEGQRFLVDLGKVLQLDEIHPALARFTLGQKRLSATQSAGNLGLCQATVFAGPSEALKEQPVLSYVLLAFQGPPSRLR